MRLEEAAHWRSLDPFVGDAARSSFQTLTFQRVRVKARRPSGANAGSVAKSPAEAITDASALPETATRQRRVFSNSPEATMISRPSAVHAGLRRF